MIRLLKAVALPIIILLFGAWIHGSSIGWFTLPIGAGGYMTGLSICDSGATKVSRTDVFGAYVSQNNGVWQQLVTLDSLSGYSVVTAWGGPYETVVAPSDCQRIYMQLNGLIWKSTNAGVTFAQTNFTQVDVPSNGGNLGGGRVNGPHMLVDPNNSDVLYAGTPTAGMWLTADAGASWLQLSIPATFPFSGGLTVTANGSVTSGNSVLTVTGSIASVVAGNFIVDTTSPSSIVPGTKVLSVNSGAGTITLDTPLVGTVTNGDSINVNATSPCSGSVCATYSGYVIGFDKTGGTVSVGGITRTKNVYVSGTGIGVYASTDGGVTFALVASSPVDAICLTVAPDGTLWTCSDASDGSHTNIWKYASGSWTNILRATTGSGSLGSMGGTAGISVDPNNSSKVVMHPGGLDNTSNAGTSFTGVMTGAVSLSPAGMQTLTCTSDVSWLCWTNEARSMSASAGLAFENTTTNTVYFAEGIGIWKNVAPVYTAGGAAWNWQAQSMGIENLIATQVVSIPGITMPFVTGFDRPVFKSRGLTRGISANYPAQHGIDTEFQIQHSWSVDYATSNHNFVCAIAQNGTQHSAGCTSNANAETPAWRRFANDPLNQVAVAPGGIPAGGNVITFTATPGTAYKSMNANYGGFVLTTSAATLPGDADNTHLHFSSVPAGITATNTVTSAGLGPQAGTGILPIGNAGTQTVSSVSGNDIIINTAVLGDGVPAGAKIIVKQAVSPLSSLTVSTVTPPNATQVTLSGNIGGGGLLAGESVGFSVNATRDGTIAISTPSNMIYVPGGQALFPLYTKDGGVTWKNAIIADASTCSGGGTCHGFNADGSAILAGGISGWGTGLNAPAGSAVADRVDTGKFYIYNCRSGSTSGGGFYRSSDGGDTWTLRGSEGRVANGACNGWSRLKGVEGHADHLFFSNANTGDPFVRSCDGAATWTTITGVTGVIAFGAGAVKPGSSYNTVYVFGTIGGTQSVYRSTDFTADCSGTPTWTDLGMPLRSQNVVIALDADQNTWNKVYVGFSASGWAWGQFNYLLKRDFQADNDNDVTPAWLDQAA